MKKPQKFCTKCGAELIVTKVPAAGRKFCFLGNNLEYKGFDEDTGKPKYVWECVCPNLKDGWFRNCGHIKMDILVEDYKPRE